MVVLTRRDRVADAAVVAAALLGLAWAIATSRAVWAHAFPSWWAVLDVAGGLAGCAALWWRRRYPVAVSLILVPLGGLFMTAGLAALLSVYAVATLRRFRVAVAVTLAHLPVAIGYYFLSRGAFVELGAGVWAVVMVLLYVSFLSVGLAVRSRRQVIAGLKEAAERDRRAFADRLDRAREAERARIAREMHDVLAHRISLLSMHAGALEYRSRPDAPPISATELAAAAGVIRQSAHRAVEELREVLSVLQPPRADPAEPADLANELGTAPPQPTVDALPRLVAQATAAGQLVDLAVMLPSERIQALRPQSQRTLFRVVQEGLTNARKHAPGSRVEVHLTESESGGVAVTVRNCVPVGTTSSEIPGTGTGLTGLAERIGVEHGAFSSGVRDGSFVLVAEIPRP